MYVYNPDFYKYISEGARQSAERLIPVLLRQLSVDIKSVLDVGCGAGAWLSVWSHYLDDFCGLDGDYINEKALLIDARFFRSADLSATVDLARRFDLVQCLEVAEHIPESMAADFVATLCRHGDIVLFSAAVPGQGGENHINEQPYSYWRDLFHSSGYKMYDPLRPELKDDRNIEPWYRYNTFVYVRQSAHASLHKSWEDMEVKGLPVDYSPLFYRWRKCVVASLPVSVATQIARIKKHGVILKHHLTKSLRKSL